jgi:octaprenyl-diphosphate synthase
MAISDLLQFLSLCAKWVRASYSNWKARRLDITEDVYYEIIRKKTATLIAACCALGAQSVIEDVVQVENMRKFMNS